MSLWLLLADGLLGYPASIFSSFSLLYIYYLSRIFKEGKKT